MNDKDSQKPSFFHEGTWLPVSLVLSILGGVAWASVQAHQVSVNTQDLAQLKAHTRETRISQDEKLDEIIQRLSRIEGQMEGLKK